MDRNFKYLLISSFVSGVGIGITLIGYAWAISNDFHLSSLNGLMLAIGNIATFLIMPYFSKWIDNYNKRNAGIIIRIFGFSFQTLCLFLIMQNYSVNFLVVSGILSTVIRSFDQVNRSALAKEVTKSEDYMNVNKWLEFVNQGITFLAGGLAALILGFGLKYIIILDASMYLVGILFLLPIRHDSSTNSSSKKDAFIEEETKNKITIIDFASINYLKSKPNFARFTLVMMIPHILILIQTVIYPAQYKWLSASHSSYSLNSIVHATGSFFAIYLTSKIVPKLGLFKFISYASLLYSLGSILICSISNLYITYLCSFTFALIHSSIRIERLTDLMHNVESNWFGRITGFCFIVTQLLASIGTFIVGYVIDLKGVTYAWIIIIIISLCFSFICFFYNFKENQWSLKHKKILNTL